jgi:hypothetical protein
MPDKTILLLGGAGLVGTQVAREVARRLNPVKIIIASLYQREVREAITLLKKEFPEVEWVGVWGDVFVREGLSGAKRRDLLQSQRSRDELYDDLMGDLDEAYSRSRLVLLIREHRPDVIVDSINTATAISYQDVYSASVVAKQVMEKLFCQIEELTQSVKSLAMAYPLSAPLEPAPSGAVKSRGRSKALERESNTKSHATSWQTAVSIEGDSSLEPSTVEQLEPVMRQLQVSISELARLRKPARRAFDTLVIAQGLPQLVRHVVFITRAMEQVGTRLYLKIGTTGTGGMGSNIPYTHGEDKPSAKLMSKTAIAFAHTGLMFLIARTPGAPIVKEIKPAAMIGYSEVSVRAIAEHGEPVWRYGAKLEKLETALTLRAELQEYEAKGRLEAVIVDTGENGLFTKGEFETITAMQQMEFITPEEIARKVALEIEGHDTGAEVISAIDGAVLNPTYRAGILRRTALEELERLERETGLPSVALGQLGPPELSKLLFEAFLLRERYHTLARVLNQRPKKIADALYRHLQKHEELKEMIVSAGVPILAPDGETIWRGPFIRIPERPDVNEVEVSAENVDLWARKGWVDLRPENFALWRERFERMKRSQERLRGRGSAAVTMEVYLSENIHIGNVVAWIFNNQEGGSRIK